ncbi:MAG TPA: type II toxin-antitoxin system VapC family toxin [Mycobacterium sp.]|nr:type II toxin-antitoxin system VapC family toxin [Mycobacterium sp.]
MIVVDASAALSALLNDGPARRLLGTERLHTPHLIDSEIANGLRRSVRASQLSANEGWTALSAWRRLAITRYSVRGLFERIWDLRDNVSAYGASYVALAESLDCDLVTADARLSRVTTIRCPVTVVPR